MKLLIMAMLLTSSAQAAASEWWFLAARDDGSQRGTGVAYYVDRASISTISDHKRVWMASVFERPLNGMSSARAYVQFDCNQKRRLVLQLETNMTNGRTNREKGSADWQFIAPDNPSNAIMSAVCSGLFYDGITFKGASPEESAPGIFKYYNRR